MERLLGRLGRHCALLSRQRAVRCVAATSTLAVTASVYTAHYGFPTRVASMAPASAAAFATVAACAGQRRCDTAVAELSRVMVPDDANPGGNVHGGTILRLVDECGILAATKYANSAKEADGLCVAALVRIEHMDFLKPMFIGEVSHLRSKVTFVSDRSMEVEVCVWAENPLTGERRLTNKARCWYVATEYHGSKRWDGVIRPLRLAPLAKADEDPAGRKRYEQQKIQRSSQPKESKVPPTLTVSTSSFAMSPASATAKRMEKTAQESESSLVQLMLPSDCTTEGTVQAGSIMKLMDNAAGIVAARHCRSNVVTASLEAMDFRATVRNANLVYIVARPIFTSSKSMDVEVLVYAEDLRRGTTVLSNQSTFTFVSLDDNHRPQRLPQLKVCSEDEGAKFTERLAKYNLRKALRMKGTAHTGGFCCQLPEAK